jgi:hypothetical protein
VVLPPKQTVGLPIQMVLAAPEATANAGRRRETYTLAGRVARKDQKRAAPDKFSWTISAEIEPHPVILRVESPNVIVVPGQPDHEGRLLLSSAEDIAGLEHAIEGPDAEHLTVEPEDPLSAKQVHVRVRAKPGTPAGNRTVTLMVYPTTSSGRELPGLAAQLGVSVAGRATIAPDRIVVPACYVGEPISISIGVTFWAGEGKVQSVIIGDRSMPFEVSEQSEKFANIRCQFEAEKSGSHNVPIAVHCRFADGVEERAQGTCIALVRERAAASTRPES